MSEHGASSKAIGFALAANLGIAATKSGAAIFTGSGSMLAEAIHSFADCANQLLLIVGLKRAAVPPDADHPLGHGKAVFFWSFIVALLLFSMGGVFSIYEGIHKLGSEEPIRDAWIGLVVLGASMVMEGLSLAGALREVKKLRGERRFLDWLANTKKSELMVVLGEDTAALAGLGTAFGFLLAATITGNPVFDAIGSICIGAILVSVAIFIGTRVYSFLLGARADEDLEEALRARVLASPGVTALHELITIQLGESIMLALKIGMDPKLTIREAIDRINSMEAALKAEFPSLMHTFVEPDVS